MKHTIISAAIALAVVGTAADAQVPGSSAGRAGAQVRVQPNAVTGTAQTPFNFNGSFFRFVPGTGFVPQSNFPQANQGPLQFVPGTGFVPTNVAQPNLITPNAVLGSGFLQPNQGPLVFVPGTGFVPANAAQPNLITPGAVFNSNFPQPNQGPLQFVPGAGFVQNPSFQPVLGAGTINPNATPTAISGTSSIIPPSGYGGGYYGGYPITNGGYPYGYYGDTGAYYGNPYGGMVPGATAVPSAYGYPAASPVITAQITSGTRSQASSRPAVNPQQVRLAARMEDTMEDRPMTEGQVLKIGATGVQVRFTADGEERTETFPVSQVYFFRKSAGTGDEELATVATEPDRIHVGDRVMVPLYPEQPQQSVAGSRQELRSDETVGTAPSIDIRMQSTSDQVRQKVAGSRESTRTRGARTRRPAH